MSQAIITYGTHRLWIKRLGMRQLSIGARKWLVSFVASGLLLFIAQSHYQTITVRSSDLLAVLVVATGAAALCAAWMRRPGASGRSRPAWLFLRLAGVASLLSSAILLTLNAVFDPGPSSTFAGVVTAVQCYKGECRLDVAGLPTGVGLRDDSTRFYVRDLGSRRAQQWDSVLVTIRPGLFRRPWVASYIFHHVDRDSLLGSRLARAAAAGDTIEIRDLLDAGVSVEAIDARRPIDGESALMAAAEAGKHRAVAMLLARGADPNRATATGETALMRAVVSRDLRVVKLLLASGANPTALTRGHPVTSVMGIALSTGDSAVIRTIAEAIPRREPVPHN
jgi:uncharacterized protein